MKAENLLEYAYLVYKYAYLIFLFFSLFALLTTEVGIHAYNMHEANPLGYPLASLQMCGFIAFLIIPMILYRWLRVALGEYLIMMVIMYALATVVSVTLVILLYNDGYNNLLTILRVSYSRYACLKLSN